jgi:hypothetical protein
VDILHDICFIALFYVCYLNFSLKADAWQPIIERDVPVRMEAQPLASVPLAKKGKQGAKAPRKIGAERAPRFASVRGHGRRSVTAVVDQVLVSVEAGASDELPLVIR